MAFIVTRGRIPWLHLVLNRCKYNRIMHAVSGPQQLHIRHDVMHAEQGIPFFQKELLDLAFGSRLPVIDSLLPPFITIGCQPEAWGCI
jgi:hypothetical protein